MDCIVGFWDEAKRKYYHAQSSFLYELATQPGGNPAKMVRSHWIARYEDGKYLLGSTLEWVRRHPAPPDDTTHPSRPSR